MTFQPDRSKPEMRKPCFSSRRRACGLALKRIARVVSELKEKQNPCEQAFRLSPLANILWHMDCALEMRLCLRVAQSSLFIKFYWKRFSFVSTKSHCSMRGPLLCHQYSSQPVTSVFFGTRVAWQTQGHLDPGLFYFFS